MSRTLGSAVVSVAVLVTGLAGTIPVATAQSVPLAIGDRVRVVPTETSVRRVSGTLAALSADSIVVRVDRPPASNGPAPDPTFHAFALASGSPGT
jgi:hypothetical protein